MFTYVRQFDSITYLDENNEVVTVYQHVQCFPLDDDSPLLKLI